MLVPFIRRHPIPAPYRPGSVDRVERRAMAIWPRLNRRALHRCHGDPKRIAFQIAHRTKMERSVIETLIADQ